LRGHIKPAVIAQQRELGVRWGKQEEQQHGKAMLRGSRIVPIDGTGIREAVREGSILRASRSALETAIFL
jgi:hypothetical protein